MNRILKILTVFCFFFLFLFIGMAKEMNYKSIISNIANDILTLKKDFPQLADFNIKNNLQKNLLKITYDYHTHKSKLRGGWSACVPNPDDDGIWFYIDIHEQDSMAQIHTQPVVPEFKIGNKILFMLILEGKNTKSVSAELYKILQRYGKPKNNIDSDVIDSWGPQKEFFQNNNFEIISWEEAKIILLNSKIKGLASE
jgi:hypothetical protein